MATMVPGLNLRLHSNAPQRALACRDKDSSRIASALQVNPPKLVGESLKQGQL